MAKAKKFKLTFSPSQRAIITRMLFEGEVAQYENVRSCVRGIRNGNSAVKWTTGQPVNKLALESLVYPGIVQRKINRDAGTCILGYISKVYEYTLTEQFLENIQIVTPTGQGGLAYV